MLAFRVFNDKIISMLAYIRDKHLKKILWAITVLVIVVFVFFGAPSLFISNPVLGKIENRKIKLSKFRKYTDLAQIHYILNTSSDKELKVSARDITSKAWELYILLWDAKKEKYNVSDQEVVTAIQGMFTRGSHFSQQLYQGFLQRVLPRYGLNLSPRDFEEYVRELIIVQKYLESKINVTITDSAILDEYKRNNQKVKINYSVIPYDAYLNEIKINEEEIAELYRTEKENFRKPKTVKFRYIAIPANTFNVDLSKIKKLEDILAFAPNKFEIKETVFLTEKDPIIGIGWHPEIIKQAFTLDNGQISKQIKLDDKVIFIEKISDKASYIPDEDDIREELVSIIKLRKGVSMAKDKAEKLLEQLAKDKNANFAQFIKDNNLTMEQTDYFKYYDYIAGIGLDSSVSSKIFTLKVNQIYSKPFMLRSGAYMIQLADRSKIDKKAFAKEKEDYRKVVANKRFFLEKLKIIYELEQRYKLEIYPFESTEIQQ